jgi:hypothetical protein
VSTSSPSTIESRAVGRTAGKPAIQRQQNDGDDDHGDDAAAKPINGFTTSPAIPIDVAPNAIVIQMLIASLPG